MTREEMLICAYELRRRGYRHQSRYGSNRTGWILLVRKTSPLLNGPGRERTQELRKAEDLAKFMVEPTEY